MILDEHGRPILANGISAKCQHGISFDAEEASRLLREWQPDSAVAFVIGNPAAKEVRRRWPRLMGDCPLGCGFSGIYYASEDHYIMGDW